MTWPLKPASPKAEPPAAAAAAVAAAAMPASCDAKAAAEPWVRANMALALRAAGLARVVSSELTVKAALPLAH